VLKVTPHIHGNEEVTLDISAAFELLAAGSSNGIPVIANTKYESKVTVGTGEWAVLAGLMTASESHTIGGIPLLSAIPLLQNKSTNRDNGQTLIVLKPHILVEPPTETPTWRAWTGSETRLPSEL
jgi:type II secretory pathway component GspD/PulD (secretin)